VQTADRPGMSRTKREPVLRDWGHTALVALRPLTHSGSEVRRMRITGRDVATTIFVAAAVAIYVLWTADIAFVTRSATVIGVIVFVLGWAACTVNQSEIKVVYGADAKKRATTGCAVTASVIGAAALITGIATLVTGSESMLIALLVAMVALWIMATARHALGWWTKQRVRDRQGAPLGLSSHGPARLRGDARARSKA
jgi:hypothetical protein